MPPQSVSPFNIMAKPTGGVCNLDCAYCYYTAKPRQLYPGTPAAKMRMSEEVLASYIRQYLELMPVRCEFGWQGGEPTLMGLDFFRRAVELQQEYKVSPAQTITNGLQTNATLLDDEWCAFLAEHKFLVGISMDGPAQWHDTFRRDHENNPSFHRAWAGLELCRKHGVEFNVLVTLNSINAPHAGDIYRYFTNRGVEYVQFIPILERIPGPGDPPWEGEPTAFSCSPEQFAKFMHEVFDLWRQRDVGRVSERLIDSVLHTLMFGQASTCCYSPRCANAHVLEFNGDLYVCDHFVYEEWRLGNIMDRPLAELIRDPMLERFAELKTALPSACEPCEFLSFCHGGCPKHHMPIATDPGRVNYYCEGLKSFFAEAIPILQEMVPYIRQGQIPPMKDGKVASPQQAAAVAPTAPGPQTVASAPPGPVGRNDPCPCGSGRKYKRCCGKS